MAAARKRQRCRDFLAEAYDRFGKDLYRYVGMVMGSRDRAEDVMQEVFLRLARVARRDQAALQSRSYVLRIARNEAYRALSKGRRGIAERNDRLLEICEPGQGSESERLAIQDALAQLPPEQREALHLKLYANMTFEEIGKATEVSQNTAASRYRYALEKLRDLLADEEESK